MVKIKSGFVNLIGPSNVGKSTFVNRVLGEKISIVSDKPQTTRNRVRCIYNDSERQIVFLDTPGLHKPQDKLGKELVHRARKSLKGADLLVYMTEPERDTISGPERTVLDELKRLDVPKLFLLNKIDIFSPEEIALSLDEFGKMEIFDEYIPISALKGNGVNLAMDRITDYLPEGERMFPPDMETDKPLEFLVSQFVREKVYDFTYREIPYCVAVETKSIEEGDEGELVKIYVDIFVVRDSQKGILIGKGGKMIKKIGKEARKDISEFLGCKVYLDLKVKVKKNWNRDIEKISSFLSSEKEL